MSAQPQFELNADTEDGALSSPFRHAPCEPTVQYITLAERGKRLDWGYVARKLATGSSVEAIANMLSCEPARIWRNIRRSRKFRTRVQLEYDRVTMQTTFRYRTMSRRALMFLEMKGQQLEPEMQRDLVESACAVEEGERPICDWLGDLVRPMGSGRGKKARKSNDIGPESP